MAAYHDYDWHYDRDHDGKLDFFEQYDRDTEDDRYNHRGIYADHSEDDEDDPRDYEADDFSADGADEFSADGADDFGADDY